MKHQYTGLTFEMLVETITRYHSRGKDVRNLIIKILKEYNLKISDVSVYFRADYSELNK